MGGGIGMFNCLYTIIQQLLCPTGYSNTFSGLCASLMIIGGIFGATGSGNFNYNLYININFLFLRNIC